MDIKKRYAQLSSQDLQKLQKLDELTQEIANSAREKARPSEYKITAKRTITGEEAQIRLNRAFDIIFDFGKTTK